jgi:hypothetical protein
MHSETLKARLFLAVCVCFVALVMLAPSTANAQVTVYHIKVVQSNAGGTATYCDGGGANPCGVTPSTGVWPAVNFPVTLGGGETLVLAQTGTVDCSHTTPAQPAGCIFGNFDTSDLVQANFVGRCGDGTPCRTQIYLDTTNTGLVLVYDTNVSGVANELAHLNTDAGNDIACEGLDFNQVVAGTGYTLATGYVDNLHLNNCNFFPTPFSGATHLVAAGAARPPIGNDIGGTNFCSTANHDCFDSGAILITGVLTGKCTFTQGYWKNHGNKWPVSTLKIGTVTYTKAQLLDMLNTPPAGGDALLILAHQLIAAKLNLLNGSVVPVGVTAAITAADALIGSKVPGVDFVDANSLLGQQMVAISDFLDTQFNSKFDCN